MTPPYLLDLPGRDAARQAAREELAKHAYQEAKPPWTQRLATWVLNELEDLLARASDHVPGGGWGLLLVALLVAVLVAVLLVRLRPARRVPSLHGLFEGQAVRSAAEHRARAESAAARGDLVEAVTERFRAVVRELEERGVLDPRPGRTADEVAAEAGRSVVALAPALLRGAQLFDAVRYGGREADLPTYQLVSELDARVREARLVVA
jgi:hypothetical protein